MKVAQSNMLKYRLHHHVSSQNGSLWCFFTLKNLNLKLLINKATNLDHDCWLCEDKNDDKDDAYGNDDGDGGGGSGGGGGGSGDGDGDDDRWLWLKSQKILVFLFYI